MSRINSASKLALTYAAYLKRAEVCNCPPTRIWVEVTSHCNLRCPFCGNRQLPAEQRGFMDFDLFKELADQSAGKVHQFNLFHRGESLLHPQIGEMIRYASARRLRTRINTNATLLNHNLGVELIDSGLDVLSFSFDGYDRETYEANRPNASFDQVLANILGFLDLRRKAGARKPFAALELMEIAPHSVTELKRKRRDFIRNFRGLRLDKFIIRTPHNWAGLVELDPMAAQRRLNRRRIPCPLLWHALVVLWDGQVLPCPQDFFGSLRLGVAGRQTLMDIWNGDDIRRLRLEMADPQSLKRQPCTECDRILRTTFAGVPLDYLGRFLSETILDNGWLSKILPH